MAHLRTLPQDIEAEQAIIAACLINPDIISKVAGMLSPSDMYREAHENILTAIITMKRDLTVLTLRDQLKKMGKYEICGGDRYLFDLSDAGITSAGWQHHSEIVKNLSNRRKLITTCLDTIDKAHDSMEDLDETLSEHKTRIRLIGADKESGFGTNRELVNGVFNDIETRARSGDHFTGLKTGFHNIDQNLRGLDPKTTTYLIAKPSMGKSSLALNIGESVAVEYHKKVVFFSLESSNIALTRRRLAARSGIYLSRIRTGDIEESQWQALINAAGDLSESNLILIDDARCKLIENLVAAAETMALEDPVSLIIVDHIQRMRSRKKTQSRHHELSWVSEELTTLANTLDVPVLILCQVKRDAEHRRNQRPQLHDMKESGDLEQNADQVWGLYRKDREAEQAELECLKGRDTGTWKTWLRFDRFVQKFYDADPPYEPVGERKFDL